MAELVDNNLFALFFCLVIVEPSWQKMTQKEGELLWSIESEFNVEFDGVNCRVEHVDSVVRLSAVSLNP